jgi:glucose/arabinose dehydrogenase
VIGIKAPPGNTECGKLAIQAVESLVKGGLYLAEDPRITFDSKKRRMYYSISRDNRKLAAELVKAGMAESSHQGKDEPELDADEQNARRSGAGCLWGRSSGQTEIPDETKHEAASSDSGAATKAIPGTADVASPAALIGGGFSQQTIITGLTTPTAFTFLPDGRILIAQKHGVIRIVKNGSLLSMPFIDISAEVNDYWDHGLIGMAADPNFATNGFVYVAYTYENDPSDYSGSKTARLSRFTASGDTASLSSEKVILGTSVGSACQNFPAGADCIPSENPSHSVGQIRFDSGGNIFFSSGDGASFNVVDNLALRAQDLTSLGGKVMHITPLGAGLSTNPFWTGDASANKSKIWASGVRNSFRLNLRSGTYPYAGDVGWDTWEEINAVVKGANLGWPCYEGLAQQPGYAPLATCQTLYGQGTSAVKFGVITYNHFYAGQHLSSAALGGTFYTGTTYPAKYQGAYFYGDYGQNIIRYLTTNASDNLVSGPFDFIFGADGPVQIEQGPDGNLYYLSIAANELRKIIFTGPDTVAPTITATNPAAGATAVALNATVSATFSKLMDPTTITSSFTLVPQSTGQPLAGSVVYDGNDPSLTFTPSVQLPPGTILTATVKGGANGVKDLSGNTMSADKVWTFTTISPQPPPSGTTDLSSLNWTSATNGWGPVELNMSNGEQGAGDGKVISIRGVTFTKGLGVHAPADIHYFIGNTCSTLTATIGIDDEVAPNGSVVFQVFGDGAKLYDSGVLTGTSSANNITVNLAGKNDLELVVTDGGDGNAFDHSDWASPRITCGTQPPPTTISNVQATGITANSATITWTTNNLADSQVNYGTTTSYGSSTPLNSSLVVNHSQQLTGLAGNTTYHYRVRSRDAGGTLVTSSDATLTTLPAGTTITYLSDTTWTSMTNGWGPAEKDKSNGEQAAGDGHTITIRGVPYSKGLGVHAASDIKYSIAGNFCTFISDIGTDDETAPKGSVVFQVWADGAKLYDSGLMDGTMAANKISVNISGKQQLELVVTDGGNGADYDHADWAGARVQCGSTPPPTVTITSPNSALTYKVGDVINYASSAKDSNGNAIPASGLAWQILIHHCPAGGTCHTHFFLTASGPTGSFTVPDHGDNSYFELDLTATDSSGLSTTTAVAIQPQTVQLTLATAPPGLQVIYGGTAYVAPVTVTPIVNSVHTIQVNSPQGANVFSSWSDGGAQQHNVTAGTTNTTITAIFSSGFAITATSPPSGATGVATNTTVNATFSSTINQATLTSQTMTLVPAGSSTPVAATLTYDPVQFVAKLTPSSALLNNTTYTATVKGGANGIKDSNGNALTADTVWSFTTAASSSGFTVTAISPPSGATGVATNTTVTARFSAAINQGTLTSQNMRLVPAGSSTPVTATLTYDPVQFVATLTPSAALLNNTTYTATVTGGSNGVKDTNGNQLSSDKVWSFTTVSSSTTIIYLSDLTWTSATNGWGPVEKDMSNGEQGTGDGHTLSIRGVTYAKGLGAHAVSDIKYSIPQGCTAFSGVVGIDDEVAPNGSVIFRVLLDGVTAYDSGILKGMTPGSNFNVNITGHTQLELVVADDGDGLNYDHADWANAQLSCSQSRPPAGTSYLSDLTWTSATGGWGPVEKDMSNGEQAAGDGHMISIRGTKYTKGLGTHAVSDIRYNLGGACTTFTAVVGIDDEVAPNGTVIFQVWTDGTKVYDSGVVSGTSAGKAVSVNTTGKSSLRLAVADDGDGLVYDHADWANAQIVCP